MEESLGPVAVTGAGSGIGKATAERLLTMGRSVIAVDRDPKGLEELNGKANATTVVGDVADDDTWEVVREESAALFNQQPKALVSNAAIVKVGTILEISEQQWIDTFEVNVMGAVRGIRALLPGMIEQGGGSIVTVGSTDAFMAEQGLAAYCTSKGALLQLTRSVAIDYAKENIRANCVCPGVTDTPFFRYHLAQSDDPEAVLALRLARQPFGRLLKSDDVAEVISFIVSPASGAITGALIPVDGGLSTSFEYRHQG